MNIPYDLKFLNFIFENRMWILYPLLAVWGVGTVYLLFRLKKLFFLWLLIFPLFIQPLALGATYCGWRYRMELRNRFAKAERGHGWQDDFTTHPVNINLMPPEIYSEYAKNNFSPRYRDLKAQTVSIMVFTPILYACGGLLWVIVTCMRSKKESSSEEE